MPPRNEPFSVPDVLADAWQAMVKHNNLLQAKNDPLAATSATQPSPAAAPVGGAPNAAGARLGAARYGSGPLLGLISRAEGTDRPDGYDVVYGYDKYRPLGGKKLTEMTLDEASALQDEMLRRGSPNTPIGKYQIKAKTLGDLRRRMGLSGSEVMKPEFQDQLGETLAINRGLYEVIGGTKTPQDFQKALALEWASLPQDPNDRSAYPLRDRSNLHEPLRRRFRMLSRRRAVRKRR